MDRGRCIAHALETSGENLMKNLVPPAAVNGQLAPRMRPLVARRGLGHLGRKLMLGRPVTLAYLGGSITCATPGYRMQATDWLRHKMPAVADHGSGRGGRRHRQQARGVPGARRCSFTSPTWSSSNLPSTTARRTPSTRSLSMEGIVRRCLRNDPQPELCFVYTLAERHMDAWRRNERPIMTQTHERIAEHYRIPSVDVAMACRRT